MNETIFISISACNEKDLRQTVLSAIQNSCNPERLYFGILDHSLNNIKNDLSNIRNVTYVRLEYGGPLGVGAPRLFASMLNDRQHDFYMQIDAHMLFEKNWDIDIINEYSHISKTYSKPIISTYVPFWYEDKNNTKKLSLDNNILVDPYNFYGVGEVNNLALKIDDYSNNLFRNHIPIQGTQVDWKDKTYHEHFLTSGHFLFSDFNFLLEIIPDPLITWGGEEPIIGLRAWTRGYNIFTIKKPIVWHKNKLGEIRDKNDWRDVSNSKDENAYRMLQQNINMSYRRIKDIFLGDYLGYWGAPSFDKLKEFEYNLNVSFSEYYDLLKHDLIKNNNRKLVEIMYE